MFRKLSCILCLILGGCLHRFVDPPAPVEDGAFLVHVVKAPDETLPKILTWYTGTTLSQQIVLRYNPYLLQREIKVGDRVLVPVELIANENPFGTAPQGQQAKAPNLLMGESAQTTDLPAMNIETFHDDTNPDAGALEAIDVGPPRQGISRAEQLQKEIAEKQRELELLQATKVPARISVQPPFDVDMPPPGLLQEFEGS